MTITHVRGDTEQIAIEFHREGRSFTPADLQDGDLLTLTVREPYGGKVVLSKIAVFPNLRIDLTHEDTKDLAIATYSYDLEFSKPDKSVVKTLVIGDFKVVRDVTF